MIRLVALWLFATGCGRWRFDELSAGSADSATPDAVTGHDEDGDGLPDVIDPCPATPVMTADTDGDGVGDACDPAPAAPSETMTVFDPLTSPSNLFVDTSAWTQEDDGLRTAADTGLEMPRTAGTIRVELGFTIHSLTATPQHQVACGMDGPTPYYFVELNENGPVTNSGLRLLSYDATNGYVGIASTPHAGMHPGRGLLQVDANVTTREFRSAGGWFGEMYMVTGPTPAYDQTNNIRCTMNGLDITIEYVMFIETS